METFESLLTAASQLEAEIQRFHDRCAVLQNAMSDCTIDQTSRNELVHNVRSFLGPFKVIGHQFARCESMLGQLANQPSDLSVIMRLPSEILSRIFVLTTAGDCAYTCETPYPNVMNIWGVCSRWKYVAEDTVALWTHIDITGDQHLSYSGYTSQLLNLSVIHSRTAPLHIHFSAKTNYETIPSAEKISQALETIRSCAPRITSLHFANAASSSHIDRIFNVCEEHGARGLKSLVIDCPTVGTGKISWNKQFLSNLVTLHINSLSSDADLNCDRLVALLGNCPGLRSLHLYRTILNFSLNTEQPTVKLPNLQFLRLCFIRSSGLARFISSLVPGTLKMHFEIHVSPVETEVDAITSFMKRSNIVALTLSNVAGPDCPIDRYLSSVRDLRSLTLEPMPGQDIARTLESLLLSSEHGRIARFPKLESLRLVGAGIGDAVQVPIKEIVLRHSLWTVEFRECTILAPRSDDTIFDWIESQGVTEVIWSGCDVKVTPGGRGDPNFQYIIPVRVDDRDDDIS